MAGWLHGPRIRKNFKTQEEAAAENAALEVNAAQFASGIRSKATFLTDDQLREAEAAFRRMKATPSVAYVLSRLCADQLSRARARKSVAEAVKEYSRGQKARRRAHASLPAPAPVHQERAGHLPSPLSEGHGLAAYLRGTSTPSTSEIVAVRPIRRSLQGHASPRSRDPAEPGRWASPTSKPRSREPFLRNRRTCAGVRPETLALSA